MTPHLPTVTADEVVRVARSLGFQLDRQKGSHAIYLRSDDRSRITVPIHKGKTLKPKTLLAILTDMGISVDEFRALL